MSKVPASEARSEDEVETLAWCIAQRPAKGWSVNVQNQALSIPWVKAQREMTMGSGADRQAQQSRAREGPGLLLGP